jgi:CBS domain containing-hemolysin-like protein
VREVMTARPRIIALEAESSVEELRQLLIEEEHSRIPVYEETIDNILGFVHGRDTLEIEQDRRETMRVRDLVRPLALVPETKPIRDLVRELQDTNAQMVIVVDEYGQTAGLVTMEDMIEEIVGEIRDESEPSRDVVEYPDKSIVSSGNLDLDRLEELVGFVPREDIESTTIGGLVCEQLGQVPAPGAVLIVDGISVEVLSSDSRRVRTVRVRKTAPAVVEKSERVEE